MSHDELTLQEGMPRLPNAFSTGFSGTLMQKNSKGQLDRTSNGQTWYDSSLLLHSHRPILLMQAGFRGIGSEGDPGACRLFFIHKSCKAMQKMCITNAYTRTQMDTTLRIQRARKTRDSGR